MKLEIDLPDELNQRLDKTAEKTGQSRTDLVIGTLLNFLDEYEEILMVVADYEEQVRNGTLVSYTTEDVMNKLDADYELAESKKLENIKV